LRPPGAISPGAAGEPLSNIGGLGGLEDGVLDALEVKKRMSLGYGARPPALDVVGLPEVSFYVLALCVTLVLPGARTQLRRLCSYTRR